MGKENSIPSDKPVMPVGGYVLLAMKINLMNSRLNINYGAVLRGSFINIVILG